MRRSKFACLIPLVTLAGPLQAADDDGQFMVRGAGRAQCETYLSARDARSPEYVSIAGWLEGYLTHVNEAEENTFDIAPWQDTELLLAAMSGYCREHPADNLHRAAYNLVRSLQSGRLIRRSSPTPVEVGEQRTVLYEEVVRRIQQRLRMRGILEQEPNGEYDAATIAAIKAFQASQDLAETGLPDQLTLARLL